MEIIHRTEIMQAGLRQIFNWQPEQPMRLQAVMVHNAKLVEVRIGHVCYRSQTDYGGVAAFKREPVIRPDSVLNVMYEVPEGMRPRSVTVLVHAEPLEAPAIEEQEEEADRFRCRACGGVVGMFEDDGREVVNLEGGGRMGPHACAYVCSKCGHEPCPCCGDWCDHIDDDLNLCCGGHCSLVLKQPGHCDQVKDSDPFWVYVPPHTDGLSWDGLDAQQAREVDAQYPYLQLDERRSVWWVRVREREYKRADLAAGETT